MSNKCIWDHLRARVPGVVDNLLAALIIAFLGYVGVRAKTCLIPLIVNADLRLVILVALVCLLTIIAVVIWQNRRAIGRVIVVDADRGIVSLKGKWNPKRRSLITISDNCAVVFARRGRMARVHGPGVVFTLPFELIWAIVDLRPQSASIMVDVDKVYKKGIGPITFGLHTVYQIMQDDAAGALIPEAVISAALLESWKQTTESAMGSGLREILSELAFRPAGRGGKGFLSQEAVEEALLRRANEIVSQWGVQVTSVAIKDVRVSLESARSMLKQ